MSWFMDSIPLSDNFFNFRLVILAILFPFPLRNAVGKSVNVLWDGVKKN